MSGIIPITVDQLLMRDQDTRADEYPPTMQMLMNSDVLLKRINELQELMQVQFTVSSGYRPGHYNTSAGGAEHSPHLTCEAIDLHDRDGIIKHKLQSNTPYLAQLGLYMEWPTSTPSWCHLQTRRPGSGSLIFHP